MAKRNGDTVITYGEVQRIQRMLIHMLWPKNEQ